TGSTPSRRQSASPIAASDRRPSSGGTSFARATIIVEARSGPNQGFARPPFTGLRVVATSNVGSPDSADESKRGAVPPKIPLPPTAAALGWRDHRLNQRPFGIRQVTRISQTTPLSSAAMFRFPHLGTPSRRFGWRITNHK